MKKLFTLLLLAFGLTSFAQVPTPTLYFTITSHNEPQEVYTTTPTFNPVRDSLKKIVDLVYSKNARYNLQTFPGFLNGSLMFESAATSTNDIIEYAYKIGGVPGNVVEIDPRFKTTALYNIADVSYSINLTGASASKNVGGFVYLNVTPPPATYTSGDWTPYTTTITAQNTPTFTWKADVMWGAGSLPPHANDANNYGQWKPRGKTDSVDFYCHDPNQTVWCQGNGCGWVLTPTTNVNSMIAEIRSEATKIRNGTYPANKFYNGHVMINFKDFGTSTVTPTFQMRYELARVLDSINLMVSQGKIAWKTITQKHNTFLAWSAANSISYSQWRCGQTVTLAPTCVVNSIAENVKHFELGFSAYPNPASNTLNFEWENNDFVNATLSFYDNMGRFISTKYISEPKGRIRIEELPPGIYFIVSKNAQGQSKPQKLVISQ